MKKIIVAICFLPVMLWAQQKKHEGIVKNEKNERIPQAKVYIYDQNDTLLKSLTTNEQGVFTFDGVDAEQVKIVIDDLEYDKLEKKISLNDLSSGSGFILHKSATEIEEVAMVKQKPVVKRKIDRLEFNVENSNISSLNGWEILKKTPGVVFSNDAFKIKGSSAILVTINDKKVSLSAEELKNLLENTQGSDVKSVEVITNPPARYEASGSAVLNIVLKQNKLEGYRGYVSGKYVQSIYPKGVGSIAQYYKKGKISAMASYSLGAGTYYREESNYIYYPEDQTMYRPKIG
ncbi:TonB-dependent receptor [Elizabethkingia meningoseptica]|uniref:TonB-dependent receptor n=1 Tax=Elizabethkingia meningoseptica TaxID=238 RepID=UPI0021AB2151|nr:carboxypeptidase-like regulatory domain-containing protein [Elizabethkingia meningoseptica]